MRSIIIESTPQQVMKVDDLTPVPGFIIGPRIITFNLDYTSTKVNDAFCFFTESNISYYNRAARIKPRHRQSLVYDEVGAKRFFQRITELLQQFTKLDYGAMI